ncbi:hypothetical protein N9U05_00080 [bacterium]|nr:hypothetical protein [bacterium]
MVADLFAADTAAGFANILMANGVSTATAYFLFPSLTPFVKAVICCVVSVVGFACYYSAHLIHERRPKEGGVKLLTDAEKQQRL